MQVMGRARALVLRHRALAARVLPPRDARADDPETARGEAAQ